MGTSEDEPKSTSSPSPTFKEKTTDRKKSAESSEVQHKSVKSESREFEAGNETTVNLFKMVLGLCVILGIIFWIRYDSFIAFIIVTVISIGLAMAVVRLLVPKLKARNIILGLFGVFLLLLILIPIGTDNNSSSNSKSTESSTES